eukprot:TRINITY_DN13399_c0_g1_i1.p1 TRINITY_DN13399_c0_g1~~TRINITY_DN13399_c0_g1_i1.p1  ORF type:complete len:298 (+),score=42.14 TRINITY_DN13399_c0_g1_i1:218-1111(+)
MGNSQPSSPSLESLDLFLESSTGKMRRSTDGSNFQAKDAKEHDAAISALVPYVQQKILELCNLERILLPPSRWLKSPQTEIWATKTWSSAPVLLIILTGIGLKIGFWGHDLCVEEGMDRGSQLPHIQRAVDVEGWAVMVLNPNQNVTEDGESILGHEDPESHFITVWKELLSTSEVGKFLLVTHSYGGVCLMKMLEKFPNATRRLYGIAMNDCGGRLLENHPNYSELCEFLRNRAKNWITSDLPLGSAITTGGAVEMMPSYIPLASAGTRRHSATNMNTIDLTFEFLKKKLAEDMPP